MCVWERWREALCTVLENSINDFLSNNIQMWSRNIDSQCARDKGRRYSGSELPSVVKTEVLLTFGDFQHVCSGWWIPTLTVVRLSNVKDLICPFSKNTFSTFGMSSNESSLSIVWKRSTKGNNLRLEQLRCFITETKIDADAFCTQK